MDEDGTDNAVDKTGPVIGSGNFLADRGYADPDEARCKFQLANQIALIVQDQTLRQVDVCRMTGLKQPDVSKIVNGNVSGFSVWRLLQVLKGLGENVTISVEAANAGESRTLAMSL